MNKLIIIMEKYKVYLDNEFCWCCEMEWKIFNKRYCAICDKNIIKNKDKVVLLVNNYKLFPNCIVHINCLPKGKVNEDVLKMLKNDYDNIKKKYNSILKKANKWGLINTKSN